MTRDLVRDIDVKGLLQLGDLASVASIKRLVDHRAARAIRVLRSCGCQMRAAGAKALAAGRELVGLVELELGSSKLDDAAIVALVASPNLQSIERLDLSSNNFGRKGLRALLAPGRFPRLRELVLDLEDLSRGGLALLLASELASRLDNLELSQAQLGDRHVAAIAKAPAIARLTRLSLAINEIGPAGAKALATSRTLVNLRRLDLGHNDLGTAGVAALARSRNFGALEFLGLRSTDPMAAGLRALAASRGFGKLRDLDLSANGLGDSDVALLGRALPTLVRLNLDWNRIGPGAATALAKRTGLVELVLSDPVDEYADEGGEPPCGIGDAGAIALAGSRDLASLRTLDLSQNMIRDAGALAIARSPHLAKLVRLELRWNHIGKSGVVAITKRFGARASVHHQRSDARPAPPPPSPPPPVRKPVSRKPTLARLAKRRGFPGWRREYDAPVPETAEAIWRETIAALVAQRAPTRAGDRKILKKFVARFDALDRAHPFIGTIEVEDIAERYEEIRDATLLVTDADDELFDTWRDF